MIRVEHSLVIERAPEDVFAALGDAKRLSKWQESCVSARSDGPLRIGAHIVERRRFLGKEADQTVEVVELEPGRRLTLEVVAGPIPFTVDHTLEPVEGGTRLTVVAEAEPSGIFRLAGRMIVRAVEQETRADFERLKELLERSTV